MSSDDITGGSDNDHERRIRALEEQNQKLEAALEQRTGRGGFDTTRRKTIAGLLGGTALLGAAGSTSAQPENNEKGAPFADKNHDHGGDYLGESEPVAQVDVTDLNTETINNRIEVATDDDLNEKLQQAEDGDALVLESGVHEVDETLRHDVNNISISGQGMRSTVIRRTGDFHLLELVGTQRTPDGGSRRRYWNIENLTLHSNAQGDTDLVHTRYCDVCRWRNVRFDGWGATGNNLYAEECWDWKFYGCNFGRGGDPDRGTADVYAYNGSYDNTNNFHFSNCRWEKTASYTLFSDTSGGGGARNGRFYLSNCKMHGFQPDDDRTPDLYSIDGTWGMLKISNSHFIGTKRGWIRQREGNGNTVQLINNNFRRYAEACISLNSKENYIANNSFWSAHPGKAIHIGPAAHETTLVSNITGGFDPSIVVEGTRTTVTGNVIDFDDFVDPEEYEGITGLRVSSPRCVIAGNVVKNAGEHGIHIDSETVATSGNCVVNPQADGIRVTDAVGGTVGSNLVRETGGAGVNLVGTTDGIAVSGNVAQETAGDGFALQGENTETSANVTL